MADISQINLPDGSSFNVKDATARSTKADRVPEPAEYDPTATYNHGDFCTHEGNIYWCNANDITGTWAPSVWRLCNPQQDYLHSINPVGNGSFSLNRKDNTTIGVFSFAEGKQNTAIGECSHAEGYNTTARNTCAHAEGHSTTASKSCSHSEGFSTSATGSNSHAEGGYTLASGDNSHAEGYHTTTLSYEAHAEGYYTTAKGYYSHAEGRYTTASHKCHHVFGEYNVEDSSTATASDRGNYVEIVGNGTADDARSNARTLDWSGNEVLAGGLKINGTQNVATQVSLTQAEYDALVQAGTVDLVNTVYFITDGNANANSASETTYDNTSSGLTATNVQSAIDEVKDDIPINATELPISGSDSTNIKDYIDFIKPLRYRYVGQLLDSKGGTVKGCGEASITLQGGLARIDFGLMLETADESSNEVWGINRDFFTSLVGKTIIPSYGGVFTYYTSAGVLYGDRHGYCGNFGLLAAPNANYWKPARIYKSASGYSTGTWASGTIGVGTRMVGTCWGTYT